MISSIFPSRGPWSRIRRYLAFGCSVLGLLVLLERPVYPQTTWACGGEGEPPCSCLTDFFWENGNLFADRGLQAVGFRVLPPIRYNASEWANLNRVNLNVAAQLINVEWPALADDITRLSAADFLKVVCIGTVVEGECYSVPPWTEPGWKIPGVGCTIPAVIPIFPPDCEIHHAGIPSVTFDWLPDFSARGWQVPARLNEFLRRLDQVLAGFPASIRGIPGVRPGFTFPEFSPESPVNLDGFQATLSRLKQFFSANAAYFNVLSDLVHDFTDPPPGAVCVNDTRHRPEPAAFRATWGHWARQNQEFLARYEPINWYSRIGTHNAFNNSSDGYLAPNQKWSLTDQLNLGSRILSLDVHWFAGKLRLSHAEADHAGAGTADRFYANGIKEIARWLRQNPREVITLSLEDRSEGHSAAVVDPLVVYLGDLLYRAVPGHPPFGLDPENPNTQWPSVEALLERGQRVLVMGSTNHGSDVIWSDTLSPGLGAWRARNFKVDVTNSVALSAGERIGPMDTVWLAGQYETRSFLDAFDPAGYLTASGVGQRVKFNIPELSFDMLFAQEESAQCPEAGAEVCSAPDVRLEAMVWGWAPGQPEDVLGPSDNGEDAAMVNSNSGRWESRPPSERHFFACTTLRGTHPGELPDRLGGDWVITDRAGTWWEGDQACEELNRRLESAAANAVCQPLRRFSDRRRYVFAAPVNGWQNARLQAAITKFRETKGLSDAHVWIACHDFRGHGLWDLNRSFPGELDRHSVVALDGVDDFVRVPQMGRKIPTDEITIEFWQKASEPRVQVTFAINGESAENRVLAHVPWVDGTVFWDFGNLTTEGRLAYRPPVSIVGSWQHFALVASRAGNYMKIFRNGIEEASKTGMTPVVQNEADLLLGASQLGQDYLAHFAGSLDEFRIWSRARTGSEIQADLYRRVPTNTLGLVAYYRLEPSPGDRVEDATGGAAGRRINGAAWATLGEVNPVVTETLVGEPELYYRLDDAPGCDQVWDSSGHFRHGTAQRVGFEPVSALPSLGGSLSLPTSDGRVVTPELDLSGGFSVSAWVKTDSLGTGTVLLASETRIVDLLRVSMDNRGRIFVRALLPTPVEAQIDTATFLAPTGWHHVVVTGEPRLGRFQVRAYLDGRVMGITDLERSPPTVAIPYYFGASQQAPPGSRAQLDEWVLHRRALSSEEIRGYYATLVGGRIQGRVTVGIPPAPGVRMEWGYADGARMLDELSWEGAPVATTLVETIQLPAVPLVPLPGKLPARTAVVFQGTLLVTPAGLQPTREILLELDGRDAVRVELNNQIVLEADGPHPRLILQRRLTLPLGTHSLRVISLATTATPELRLSFTGASLPTPPTASWYDASFVVVAASSTGADGSYVFERVLPGADVRPHQEGWSFAPESVKVHPPVESVDFVARRSPPVITLVAAPSPVAVDTPVTVEFSVSDGQTPAEQLVLQASSSAPDLVPNTRLELGGQGHRRTVVVRPLAGRLGSATIELRVTDGDGMSSVTSFRFETRADAVGGLVSGALGRVAGVQVENGWAGDLQSTDEIPFGQPPLLTTSFDRIDFEAGAGSFFAGGPSDRFAAEFQGEFEVRGQFPLPNLPQPITLRLTADDGAQLVVDGEPWMGGAGSAGTTVSTASRLMPVGRYSFVLRYFENTGDARLRLELLGSGRMLGGTVRYWDTSWRPLSSTTTDANGRYTLLTVPAGSQVRAIQTGWSFSPAVRTVSPPSGDQNFQVSSSAPFISAIADPAPVRSLDPVVIPFLIGDHQTPPNQLGLRVATSDGELLPLANLRLQGSGVNRSVVIQPLSGRSGLAEVSLRVTDAEGLEAIRRFRVDFRNPSVPPRLTIRRVAETLVLSWPRSTAPYVLQQSDLSVDASGGFQWSDSPAEYREMGEEMHAEVPPANKAQLYRLLRRE